MKYKAICFDIDGTLYPAAFLNGVNAKLALFHPYIGSKYRATRDMFRECQKDFAKEGLEDKDFGYREAAMFVKANKSRKSVEDARKYLDRAFYNRLKRIFSKLPCQPDVVQLLRRLKNRGYVIGVMTDWPLWNKLESIGVAEYCDFKCDPSQMGYLKPDAHTFEYLLYNLKLDASQVLYVGDSYDKDIEGAASVGIDAVLVNKADNGNYPKAMKVFKNWEDFSFWMEAN